MCQRSFSLSQPSSNAQKIGSVCEDERSTKASIQYSKASMFVIALFGDHIFGPVWHHSSRSNEKSDQTWHQPHLQPALPSCTHTCQAKTIGIPSSLRTATALCPMYASSTTSRANATPCALVPAQISQSPTLPRSLPSSPGLQCAPRLGSYAIASQAAL